MATYDRQRFSPPAPIATVSITNRETKATLTEVGMLIDSGADISVLPETSVHALALPVGDSAYEVMAYDNTVLDCQVVGAEVVFLRKRFKGQFLVLDQEVGVLGRDVLNHVVLVLDGPRLEWDSR
jgi:hypothetical protein